MLLNWTTTNEDFDKIVLIARRASSELHIDYRIALMDVQACHGNGTPLDLNGLILAEAGDFAHDVLGIRRYIDRETGKLTECFIPRYAEEDTK